MMSLLVLIVIPILVSSNVCREECDNAFVWYTYDICWTQYYYGGSESPPINENCIEECTPSTVECLENAQCFNTEQTWCDMWQCDCSYQCDYFNYCVNQMINNQDIDCSFQETCYAACPDEDDGYQCIEENCMQELEACFYDEACLNAVENFDQECEENNNGDLELCIENADQETLNKNCEDLDDGSEDLLCVEAFGALGGCVLQNECHKNLIEQGLKGQSLGLKKYGKKQKSLKQKNMARNKRLKVERERKLKKKVGNQQFQQRRRAKYQKRRKFQRNE